MDFPTIGGLPAHPLIVHEVPRTALVERHAELADGLMPWVIGHSGAKASWSHVASTSNR